MSVGLHNEEADLVPRHGAWDLLRVREPRLSHLRVRTPTPLPVLRRVQRTAGFDEGWTDEGALRRLCAEYEDRVAYWSRVPPLVRSRVARGLVSALPGDWIFVVMFAALAAGVVLPPVLIAAVGVPAFGLAVLAGRRRRRRVLLSGALVDRTCPDCAYDLAGTPAAIDFPGRPDVNCGPAACPECGSPWPLLPPPVPDG